MLRQVDKVALITNTSDDDEIAEAEPVMGSSSRDKSYQVVISILMLWNYLVLFSNTSLQKIDPCHY